LDGYEFNPGGSPVESAENRQNPWRISTFALDSPIPPDRFEKLFLEKPVNERRAFGVNAARFSRAWFGNFPFRTPSFLFHVPFPLADRYALGDDCEAPIPGGAFFSAHDFVSAYRNL
jgi:hypothetical protein